jgi:hypothetical protein
MYYNLAILFAKKYISSPVYEILAEELNMDQGAKTK